MRGHRRFPPAVAALVLMAGCGQGQAPGNAPGNDKERKETMEGIMVTAGPVKAAVLPGESLVIKSTVQNRGQAAVNVPSDQAASPLSYKLQSDGGPGYEVSWELYETQKRVGLAPAMQLDLNENLPPGGTQIRNEDIALYSNEPFAIGKYKLTTAWTHGSDQAVSGFTRVVVAKPAIEAWASEVCRRTEELRSVFAHKREDGEIVIYERSSRANRPEFGVFHPLLRLPKKTEVKSVAPAVVLEDSGQGVWLAWIAGKNLRVVGALAGELNAQPEAQPVSVGDPRVIAPGFQLGPGRVVFFVAGKGPAGPGLELWEGGTAGIKRLWQAPLGPAGPIRILARKGEGSPTFVVIFEEVHGAGRRLWRRDYDLKGPRGEARMLAEFPKPLLAWMIEPIDYPTPARLVVAHHDGEPEDVQAREVDLEGKGPAEPTKLPSLPKGSPAPDLWAVVSYDGRLHVGARQEGKILYSEAGWTAWKQVGTSAPGPGWLHLFSPHSIKLWAEWCVVDRGPLRTQLLQTRDALD